MDNSSPQPSDKMQKTEKVETEKTDQVTEATERSKFSPYKEVQVLQLGWQTDTEAGRRNFKALEKVWYDYGYGPTTIPCELHCENSTSTDENKKDVEDVVYMWQENNDNEPFADMPKGQREKLLIVTYVGHATTHDFGKGQLEELIATDHTGKLTFSLTALEKSLRDSCARCDVLTILECCDGDFDADIYVPNEKDDGFTPSKDFKTMETLAAGFGEIFVDQGKDGYDDFLQRLARDLMEYKAAWTVKERAERIRNDSPESPGSYRRIDEKEGEEEVSIVLAPMRQGDRSGSMSNARLWDSEVQQDFRQMGIGTQPQVGGADGDSTS